MSLSEPQYSLCYKETNSKAEQGNDNLIACDGNGNSTATESYSISADHIRRATQQQSSQPQQLQFRDSRGLQFEIIVMPF